MLFVYEVIHYVEKYYKYAKWPSLASFTCRASGGMGVSSVVAGVSSAMEGVSSAMEGVTSVVEGVTSVVEGVSSTMAGVSSGVMKAGAKYGWPYFLLLCLILLLTVFLMEVFKDIRST